jgi:hypothetical protein
MTIDGSEVTLVIPDTDFVVSTSTYSSGDDPVVLTGSAENTDFTPCEVELNDDLTLALDDASVSLDQNDTLSVTWFPTKRSSASTSARTSVLSTSPVPAKRPSR